MSFACSRRRVLAAGLVLAGEGLLLRAPRPAHASTPPPAERALGSAVAWTARQRTAEGLYPSQVYGLLRGGASTTPFTLLAVSSALAISEPDLRASLLALSRRCSESGALGLREVVGDYPCYATGMLLSLVGSRRGAPLATVAKRARRWLLEQQLTRERGWDGHPAQGGWGMGATALRTPPDAGYVDLSMTRRVIEGLVFSGLPPDHPALREAREFVLRCQSADGSFFYSPVELALNKGLSDEGLYDETKRPRGYGSATTDGCHALAALGDPTAEPARRGHAWLLEHHRIDANPGVEGGPMHLFAQAMRGYYRAGAATWFARVGGPTGWRDALVDAICAEQREDGSFANPNRLQKEDDPLLATGFAITALAAAREPGRAGASGSPRGERSDPDSRAGTLGGSGRGTSPDAA